MSMSRLILAFAFLCGMASSCAGASTSRARAGDAGACASRRTQATGEPVLRRATDRARRGCRRMDADVRRARARRGWELMWHGNVFLQFINESAPEHRGAHQTGSINWVMGMARRRAGAGRVGVRTMLSLEPWTIRGCGYPDLLATGETCDGDTIHDRQHPHDLFMELALEYERPLSGGLRWFAYGGPAGEPALGPVAFPHRVSALANPIAPIAHHWLDATHITFGVITTGVAAPAGMPKPRSSTAASPTRIERTSISARWTLTRHDSVWRQRRRRCCRCRPDG